MKNEAKSVKLVTALSAWLRSERIGEAEEDEEGVPLFSVLSSFPNFVRLGSNIKNKLGKFTLSLIYLGFIIYAPNNSERNLAKVVKKNFDERERGEGNNPDWGNNLYTFPSERNAASKAFIEALFRIKPVLKIFRR